MTSIASYAPLTLCLKPSDARDFRTKEEVLDFVAKHPQAKEVVRSVNYKRPMFQITNKTASQLSLDELERIYTRGTKELQRLTGNCEGIKLNPWLRQIQVDDDLWETTIRWVLTGTQTSDFRALKKIAPEGFDTDVYKATVIDHCDFESKGDPMTKYIQCQDSDTMVFESIVKKASTAEDDHEGVNSDTSAFDAVMAVHGSKLKRFNQKVYAFDHSSGLWRSGDEVIGIFMRWSREVNGSTAWGTSSTKMRSAFAQSATLSSDEDFFKRAEDATLGKLLFRNAIWDIENKCRLEFDPKYFFHARIDRDLPRVRASEVEDRVRKILFDDPHPNAEVRSEFMKGLAGALTGRNPKRSLWFNLGGTGTGKSTLVNSLKNTYGGFVDMLAAENLAIAKFSGTNDHCGWKMKFRNARIVLTSECSTSIRLDGNLLKGVSGGDPLVVRPIGCEAITVSPQATLFSFANEFPAIDPVDEAMRDRLLAIKWCVKFTKGEGRDETISDFLKTPEACDALFWILNDAYDVYLAEGFKEVPEITQFTTRLTNELDEFRQLFESNFEIGGPHDLVRTGDVYCAFREWSKSESRIANKLELDFGVRKEHLRNKDVWEGKQRCFSGLKRIVNDDAASDY